MCHDLGLLIWSIQKISHSLNVNFKATHANLNDLPFFIMIFLKSLEYHSYWARDKSHGFFSHSSLHGKGFSSRGLTVSENANFEAVKSTSYYISNFIENVFLSRIIVKNFIEFEFIRLVLLLLLDSS